MDVAEIRSMSKPPAAVEVVMEAVMILLTGRTVPAKDMHRLLSGGEAFLLMLREFDIEQVILKPLCNWKVKLSSSVPFTMNR